MSNEDTGETFGEIKLKQIYISFELFSLRKEECVTPFEKLIYILKNMNLFDMSPFKEKNDAFKRLLDVANLNAMTPHERAVYDENLKIYRDWRNTLEYAVEEAEVKGLKKGKIEGIAEGLAKGKAEGQRQIAANLKNQGVNIETITLCTGLSVEEINEL